MNEKESVLTVKGISTTKVVLGSNFVSEFTAKLKAGELPEELIVLQFDDIIFAVLPIIDSFYPTSSLLLRFIVLNFGSKINYKYGFSQKKYPENAKPNFTETIRIPDNQYFYFDKLIDAKEVKNNRYYIAIGAENKNTMISLKGTRVIEDVHKSRSFLPIELPVKKVTFPTNFQDLQASNFLGLLDKDYIDKKAIPSILRRFELEKERMEKLGEMFFVVCCSCMGVGLLYLPFWFLKRSKEKKRLQLYLEQLHLSEKKVEALDERWSDIL